VLLVFFEWHTISAELQRIQNSFDNENHPSPSFTPEGHGLLVDRGEYSKPFIFNYFIAVYGRVMMVTLWYAVFSLLGISSVGVILYRLLEVKPTVARSDTWSRIHHVLWQSGHWLAVRFIGFIYALVGDFTITWTNYRQLSREALRDHEAVLWAISLGSLGIKNITLESSDFLPSQQNNVLTEIECVSSFRSLVFRSLILWGIIIFLLHKV
ncbi:MAG: hypothetical protein QM520_06485, partial [Gammaproteobacteria bacterium]|nr:hypothetical protein [Gammaproteobacteria bacterium]